MRSPCTVDIAVFRAFADTVAHGENQFVVIDTAPTGHTLLLLDAAEAYRREVLREPSGSSEAVRQLLPRLRDPLFSPWCCSSRFRRPPRFTRPCICASWRATPGARRWNRGTPTSWRSPPRTREVHDDTSPVLQGWLMIDSFGV